MRRLAFDCSGDFRSVAVSTDGVVHVERAEEGSRSHAERLVPLMNDALAAARWSWQDIDELVVATGPGSFTGIRIAVAAARALALALDRRVRAVSTLRALLAVAGQDCTIAAIDARRGGVYYALPDGPERAGDVTISTATPDAAASMAARPLVAIGSGARLVCDAAGEGQVLEAPLRASALVACAVADAAGGQVAVDGGAVRPVYLRAADAVPRAA